MNKLILIAAILVFAFSCTKDKYGCMAKEVSKENVQGKWTFVYNYISEGYRDYIITFTKDSFYFIKANISDLHIVGTPCESGYWTDFAKGSYTVINQMVNLDGYYTDSVFVNKYDAIDSTKECFLKAVGNFKYTGKVSFCNDTLILEQTAGTYSEVQRLTMIKK